MATFLPLLDLCDNYTPRASGESNVATFIITDIAGQKRAIGLVRAETVAALEEDNALSTAQGLVPSWILTPNEIGSQMQSVAFAGHLDTRALRSETIQKMCRRWHEEGKFASVIGGRLWRDELYSVYADPFNTSVDPFFDVERVTAALFGFVTYGVHMTIYQAPTPGSNDEIKIWVSKRSQSKQTWPGFYDNTIAGGIVSGISPLECMVKESMEEGSFTEEVISKHARHAGGISYYFQTKLGWLQPEFQYVFDLAVPPNLTPEAAREFVPKPLDGEVEAFELLPVSSVVELMHQKLFKPNCALVLLDFFIRHNIITPSNEPHYLDIIARLHGRFDIERW